MKYFHIKLFIPLLVSMLCPLLLAQQTGFDHQGKEVMNLIYQGSHFHHWADSVHINGNLPLVLTNNSREIVTDAELTLTINNRQVSPVITNEGYYVIQLPPSDKTILIDVSIVHPEFHSIDTSFIVQQKSLPIIEVDLKPRYLILLRGRVMAHNIPIEGADITLRHLADTVQTTTLGCYYDEDDYYNCLYNGMFKERIATDNPADSIDITIRKDGFIPLNHRFIFNEYHGDILEYKLSYAKLLPEVYKNNVSLKLTIPLISDDNWFAAVNYIRGLNIGNFNRLGLGAEASVLIKEHTESFPSYRGKPNAKADTSYLVGFAGPTLFIWITNPLYRRYSVYAGNTFAYEFNTSFISLQPFAGCRFFLDLNKAISLDIRYLNYEIDLAKYDFNLYGSAQQRIERVKFANDILISLGFHIGF